MSLKSKLLGPTVIAVLENKGGVAKSTTAQGVIATLRNAGFRVQVENTDEANNNMALVGLSDQKSISVRTEESLSGLYEKINRLKEGAYDHLVIDTGATDESYILPKLAALERRIQAAGAVCAIIRPVTTSHFTQANAAHFARIKNPKTGLILARIEAMGRRFSDYAHWLSTETRKEIIAGGAVEFAVGTIGPVVADNATAFGLPLVDLALDNYSRAGENEALARQFITSGHCATVADWLADFERDFGAALVEVVKRSRALG
jgi:AAA domain